MKSLFLASVFLLTTSLFAQETKTENDTVKKKVTTLDEVTIKNSIYTIKFEFGHNTKIFKYKHG